MLYVKAFKREFVSIMKGRSPVLAVDDIYGHPLNTIVGMGAFDNASAEDCKQVSKLIIVLKGNIIHQATH